MKTLNCLRCQVPMKRNGTKKIQLGQTGWVLGDLPNLISGALEADLYTCPQCGKIELFLAENHDQEIPQVKCPVCGKMHDFDYPKCPFCKYEY